MIIREIHSIIYKYYNYPKGGTKGMGFSQNYKEQLNILLPFYRKQLLEETQDKAFQQAIFYIDDRTGNSICSSTVYSGLENQKHLAHDEVYLLAANKLNKKCLENIDLEKPILQAIDKVYQYMEYKDEKKCSMYLNEILPSLKNHCSNFLVYGEYIWVLELLSAFFKSRNQLMSKKDFLKLDAISGIFKGKFYDIVICYLHIYCNFNESNKISYIYDKYDYERSTFISNQMYVLSKLIRQNRKIKALELGKKLINQMIEANNFKRLPILYIDMATLLRGFDKKESHKYIELVLQLLDEEKIEENSLFVIYLNLGAAFIAEENYKLSIQYHEMALQLSNRVKNRCYSCLCYCYHMLEEEIPELYMHYPDVNNGDELDLRVYDFYYTYQKNTSHENIQCIMKTILPYLTKHDWLYIVMFENELEKLHKSSKGYKALYEFYKIIKKMNKNNVKV